MKLRRFQFLAGLSLALALLPLAPQRALAGQTTLGDVKKETADAAEAIKNYTAEQRDEAVKKTKAALDDLDQRIDRLEAHIRDNWSRMDQAARDKSAAALRSLRKQREKVAEWYGGLEHGSSAAWDKVKHGFSEAYEKLKASWQKAEKEFDSGD